MFPTQDWLLTQDEIAELTGAKQRRRKIQWLAEHKYPFEIGLDGQVKVLRSYVESKLGIAKLERKKTEPNWKAFRAHLGTA